MTLKWCNYIFTMDAFQVINSGENNTVELSWNETTTKKQKTGWKLTMHVESKQKSIKTIEKLVPNIRKRMNTQLIGCRLNSIIRNRCRMWHTNTQFDDFTQVHIRFACCHVCLFNTVHTSCFFFFPVCFHFFLLHQMVNLTTEIWFYAEIYESTILVSFTLFF